MSCNYNKRTVLKIFEDETLKSVSIYQQKKEFIDYLYTIPFVKKSGLCISFFEQNIKTDYIEIRGEEQIFFSLGFVSEEYDLLKRCYEHLDLTDTNGDILVHFNKVVDYFIKLIHIDIPFNYDSKSFRIIDGVVSSAIEIYLCDRFSLNDQI
jgi:hypothetical protein